MGCVAIKPCCERGFEKLVVGKQAVECQLTLEWYLQ
jgi:hypothetical protein